MRQRPHLLLGATRKIVCFNLIGNTEQIEYYRSMMKMTEIELSDLIFSSYCLFGSNNDDDVGILFGANRFSIEFDRFSKKKES